MHEQAELTALTLPSQLLNSVGMADGAVVVPERNSGHHALAFPMKRWSIKLR
jgi:hypothetical protein